MPSAIPERDISAKDHRWQCRKCTYKHNPDATCPAPLRWLISGGAVRTHEKRAE